MLQGKTILLLIFFFIPFLAHAQQGQIQFSRIDVATGLSHNEINAILKDSKGLMWFGSLSGLNRFDGYQFKVFKHDAKDSTSIIDNFVTELFELPEHRLYIQTRSGPTIYNPELETFARDVKGYLHTLNIKASSIRNILTDQDGNFWFNALTQGVFKYNIKQHTTLHFKCDGRNNSSLVNVPVAFIQKDPNGGIWVIHDDKTVELLNRATGKVVKRILALRQAPSAQYEEIRMFVDKDSDLWIYKVSDRSPLTFYKTSTGEKRTIDKGADGLNSNLLNGIVQDGNGTIWIGTDNGGLNLLDKKTFSIRYLSNKDDDARNSAPDNVICLYKDASGIIWAGTFKKGVSFYHEKIIKFPLFRHQVSDPNGLTYDDINRFAEDKKGNIWVGTNGGGLFYFNRKTSRFTGYKHLPSDPNSLGNDIIVSLFVDKQDKLWIGTYYGGLDYFDGHTFKHYRADSKDPKSLSDDRVWDIMEDSKGRLWVATLSGGLDLLDRRTQTFIHHKAVAGNSLGSNFISSVVESRDGSIWIGTSDGVDEMKSNGQFIHYKNIPGKSNSLINNVVYSVMQDSYGFIWITTRDGLSRLDPKTRQFRNFDTKDGLTEKATLKIVEDNSRNLWVSTANGLFAIIVRKAKHDFSYAFRRYDAHDGLQEVAFNANAGFKASTGELMFGGTNGFNIFHPERIRDDNSIPVIILSDLQIANKSISVGERVAGRVLLHKSILFTKELELKYNQNALTLEFAALNFFNPQKIKYRYKLEGFDQRWQELQGDIRRATYTNIDPGVYTFKVVSTNVSGNWVNNPTSLTITILPPLWRTSAAYLFYVLLVAGSLLLFRHRGIQKIRKKMVLEQERIQSKRMHELDMLKIKFLTNVSHEFRTPLSLIITPLEKLIKHAGEAEKPQLQMIHRNGRRLLNLVNQLLDFRRMEVQQLKLQPKTGDIILFIQESALAFTDVAERKNILFSVHTDRASLVTSFDYDKIERILFNLLSNAFKFTLPGGCITVSIACSQNDKMQTILLLKVSDTGIGIEQDKTEKVFNTFFQSDVPNSIVNQGSGIGLSITKEFVNLHGGTITVDSVLGVGTTFTVTLLFADEQQDKSAAGNKFDLIISGAGTVPKEKEDEEAGFTWKSKKPVVMLVEDNEDFRFYLKDNLKEFYQIVEAANGKEGWQRILSAHPDLVVSDVSMPEMDGIELCKKIKSDQRTAHLPVILLTALNNENQQLTGLETGASDYMTKPFNFEILLSKIKNLLLQQAQAKKTFQKHIQFTPPPTEVESVDDKFIRQLSAHIEKHLSDPGYTVDQLSTDMNMSRVGLYKKILPLTGKSPIEYIRSYRLQKAKPLLLKSQMTIAEVAYAVGFSNPKHFSKYFKQEFGILPSAYALTKEDKTPDLNR